MIKAKHAGLFFLSLALVWEAVARSGYFPSYLFPSLVDIAWAFWDGLSSGAFVMAVLMSLKRLFSGYLLALLIGTGFGLGMAQRQWMDNSFGLFFKGLSALPSVCWLPLALLWFGLGDMAILFVVFMGSLASASLGVQDAVMQVPPILLRAGKNLGAQSPLRLAVDVLLPAALIGIVAAYRQAWSLAWRSLMAAELLFSTPGLGQQLAEGRELSDMPKVLAVILLILIVGLAVESLLYTPFQRNLTRRYGLSRDGH